MGLCNELLAKSLSEIPPSEVCMLPILKVTEQTQRLTLEPSVRKPGIGPIGPLKAVDVGGDLASEDMRWGSQVQRRVNSESGNLGLVQLCDKSPG